MHQFHRLRSKTVESIPLFGNPVVISKGVRALSDLYISKKTKLSTIWQNPELAKSYLSYFLPLNIFRLSYVLNEARTLGFLSGLEHLIDFGSGPGTSDLSFGELESQFKSLLFIESEKNAIEWHKKLLNSLQLSVENKTWLTSFSGPVKMGTLVVLSYALNEIPALPSWATDAEAILIVEPSTQEAGRKLQALRKDLIKCGYHIWAPCTHQNDCPLLELSKTDWCHQRIHVELSPALVDIENNLPIKNQSLTFSYLLARRTLPTQTKKIRVIGDTLFERGKIKQAICRGPKREFLTWLTRHGDPEPIPRGALIDLPEGSEQMGNEIRIPFEINKTKD